MAAIDILFDCMKSIAENLCILSQKFEEFSSHLKCHVKKNLKIFSNEIL